MSNVEFEEVQLADDLKESLKKNSDIFASEIVISKINSFNDDELLVVKKTIGSKIEILNVKIVDEDYIVNAFPSLIKK